ncbi:MAG TPA: hypothetical protein VM841_04005 [Actinomycetota bacterium]|nr:hypothetical protein [Actinomycetota bacterium]
MQNEHADLTANDPEGLGRAAREGMRALVLNVLERKSVSKDDLEACPVCGDVIIHSATPESYVKDRALGNVICAPCGTERSVLHMVLPDNVDIGGPG